MSLLLPFALAGQITDCVGAEVICSDGPVNFTPFGTGINDFANPNNDQGCLESQETESAWYYFEFFDTMPPGLLIEFTISPNGGFGEDYDFAIFGPDRSCDSLGSPVRCSFAWLICDFCPLTGLGNGAIDESEGIATDGFVAPMVVQPGQGFYLLLDNFSGTSNGFELTWGGSAAPYLNCNANLSCNNLLADAGSDVEICNGEDPIQLQASATGAGGNEVYSWSGTAGATAFLNDPNSSQPMIFLPGEFSGTITYTLTISDGDCISEDSVVINVLPAPLPEISADSLFCPGQSATLDGGPGFAAYFWSNDSTNQMIDVFTEGTYFLTVTNEFGCEATDSVLLGQYTLPGLDIQGDTLFCSGDTVILNAGDNFAGYLWQDSSTSQFLTTTLPGDYSVDVVDVNGCVQSASATLSMLATPTPQINGIPSFCSGEGTLLQADAGYDSYLWQDGSTGMELMAAMAGDYKLTVTASNGCEGVVTISVSEIPSPNLNISGMLEFCQGNSSVLDAGPGFVSYQWDNGSTGQTLEVSAAGSYSVIVTNADGCTAEAEVIVTENELPQPVVTGEAGFCTGLFTTLSVDSGFSSYTWSDGSQEQSIQVDQAGVYSLTVTDENACSGSYALFVFEWPEPTVSITGEDAFCPGDSTLLSAEASGNVSYSWSNGETTAQINVAIGGTYFVTVADSNACAASDSLVVMEYTVTEPDLAEEQGFCAGSSLILDAGVSYASYLWQNNSTGQTLEADVPGLYSLTVTDVNGCTAEASTQVSENPLPNPAIIGNPGFCPGNSTMLEAGEEWPSYLWPDGTSAESIEVSTPGLYILEVIDSLGCMGNTSIDIVEHSVAEPNIIGNLNFCPGDNTLLDAGPGFSAYEWSDGSSTQFITVNVEGEISVILTDTNGCMGTAMVFIEEFETQTLVINGETEFCNGDSVTLQANSGYINYLWSDNSQEQSLLVTNEGTYSLTVTDANGCSSSLSRFVDEIELPLADAGVDQVLDCDTRAIPLGGNSSMGDSLVFFWDGPGINPENASQIFPEIEVAGQYHLLVTDTLHNCTSLISSVEIMDLAYEPNIVLSLSDVLDCNTPEIFIDAGGSESGNDIVYQLYDGNGDAIAGANGLVLNLSEAGDYHFEVIDTLRGCKSIKEVTAQADFDIPLADAGAPAGLDCTHTSAVLDGSASEMGAGISIIWTTPDGNVISGEDSVSPEVDQPGMYIIRVSDEGNGCSSTDTVRVSRDIQLPEADAGPDQELDCTTDEVLLSGAASSSGGNIEYQWSSDNNFDFSDATTHSPEVNLPGTYTLLVTNTANGCTNTDVVIVTENIEFPHDVSLDVTDPACFGDQDGSIIVEEVFGGTAPYLFSIEDKPFVALGNFTNLPSGSYALIVQDIAGCEFTTTVSLSSGGDPVLDLGEDRQIKIGETFTIDALTNIPEDEIAAFQWISPEELDCDNCMKLEVRPFVTTTYAATIVDQRGCRATDELTLFVQNPKEVFIPNAFSPNNDGINDIFMIYAGGDVSKIKSLQVVDRWGGFVFGAFDFPANDPHFGWDGRVRNKTLNPAVFVYFAEIEFIDGELVIFKGDVTLVK